MSTYQLKVTLEGVQPPIWRRFQVPDRITLARLHLVLLAVMGWGGGHLYEFEVGRRRIGEPDDSFGYPAEDASRVELRSVAHQDGARLTYVYDFGDGWEHQVLVEKTSCPGADGGRVACLDGRRACPPDDCGGVWGYRDLLAALDDPAHPESAERREWLQVVGPFDPELFDPAEVTTRLTRFDPLARTSRGSLTRLLTG
jgi:hypothetical protein